MMEGFKRFYYTEVRRPVKFSKHAPDRVGVFILEKPGLSSGEHWTLVRRRSVATMAGRRIRVIERAKRKSRAKVKEKK